MLRAILVRSALAAAALVLCAHVAPAQVKRIPDSGCPNAKFPEASRAVIGLTFTAVCRRCPSDFDSRPVMIIGRQQDPLTFGPPKVCTDRPCVLNCIPEQTADRKFAVEIPRDRNLVGAEFCVQCICLNQRGRCFTLSGALRVRIEQGGGDDDDD